MNKRITFLLIAAITIGAFTGCGPSEEEKRRAEQARQDSLKKVRQQQLEQQRQDSIEQARKDSLAAAEKKAEEQNQIDVTFDDDGAYTVQVEAWRSRAKAEAQVQKWVDRGFEDAFVVKYGTEETGNIWFRVRLGRLGSREAAEELQAQLRENYNAPSWISVDGT